MQGENPKTKVDRVRFQYNLPEGVKPLYVNGVYGGITPRGDLLCHFFYEYIDIPEEESAPVENGHIDAEKIERTDRVEHEKNERILRRDIRVSMIIPVQQINNIAEWMVNKLEDSSIIVERDIEEKE